MSHRRALHRQAPATRMPLGKGMRQSCSHLCPAPATTPANAGSMVGCRVAQCITPQLYLDLGAGRSLVLPRALEERKALQKALSIPGSSLLGLSPHWQGMSKLWLVNLTSQALFQEQQ